MGKRSDFPRRKNDLYATTDSRVIPPLLPHLPAKARYVEPCAGSGALISLVGAHAHCVHASDIAPGADGVAQADMMQAKIGDADIFLTNPPWTRALLHDLIVYLSDQAPTFLLFDADWAHTKQAQKFMSRCRKIISVGRVKWVLGSPSAGKDNVAWYEFGLPRAGSFPQFFTANAELPASRRPARICYDCGNMIGQSGKWTLANRSGVVTPVHRHCDNPESHYAKGAEPLAPAPLLDWMAA